MGKLLLVLLMLATPLCHGKAPVILVYGDSLSAAYGIEREEGWVALLEARLMQSGYPHRVINGSISGETTFGGLTRLPEALSRFEPTLLVIELGGNDGLRGLDFQQTRQNLSQMVELGRSAGIQVLLLGIMLPPNFGRSFTEKFLAIYQEVADRTSVPLVPFFLEGVAERREWMQSDGIHPNRLGQARMLENVWERLEPLLRSMPVKGLPE